MPKSPRFVSGHRFSDAEISEIRRPFRGQRVETALSFKMSAMPIAEQASSSPTALDLTWVRSQFPALAQTIKGHPAVFLDGPGGTQVPQQVIDAIADYLSRNNANTGGAYHTSRNTDRMIAEARAAMGDYLNCAADEIMFGPNMTTLTYAMSRAIGRELV